jgi:hypothetical protein
MDFFRGTPGVKCRPEFAGSGARPWNQYVRFVDRLALIEGTATWAAKLSDPAIIEQLWEEYQKDRTIFDQIKDVRPSLIGFDRKTQMLTNIANLIVGHRIDDHPSLGRALEPIPTPRSMKDIIEERWSDHAKTKRISAIEQAQARWEEQFERTGVRPN